MVTSNITHIFLPHLSLVAYKESGCKYLVCPVAGIVVTRILKNITIVKQKPDCWGMLAVVMLRHAVSRGRLLFLLARSVRFGGGLEVHIAIINQRELNS